MYLFLVLGQPIVKIKGSHDVQQQTYSTTVSWHGFWLRHPCQLELVIGLLPLGLTLVCRRNFYQTTFFSWHLQLKLDHQLKRNVYTK